MKCRSIIIKTIHNLALKPLNHSKLQAGFNQVNIKNRVRTFQVKRMSLFTLESLLDEFF